MIKHSPDASKRSLQDVIADLRQVRRVIGGKTATFNGMEPSDLRNAVATQIEWLTAEQESLKREANWLVRYLTGGVTAQSIAQQLAS